VDNQERGEVDGAATVEGVGPVRPTHRRPRGAFETVPVYEYRCVGCGEHTDRLLPHHRVDEPGPCPACDGRLQRRFSRIAVKLEGWGFSRTDGLVADRPGRGDFKQVRERAERISEGDA
jgi:putative FmdB family regulatory protein